MTVGFQREYNLCCVMAKKSKYCEEEEERGDESSCANCYKSSDVCSYWMHIGTRSKYR